MTHPDSSVTRFCLLSSRQWIWKWNYGFAMEFFPFPNGIMDLHGFANPFDGNWIYVTYKNLKKKIHNITTSQ